MKKLLTLFTMLFVVLAVFGQEEYQELLIIKADGNWDKLIKKAEHYTLEDKTHKDPIPYFYLSYGLYKISFDANRDEKYKGAFKDAYTAIGKMIRYDKSGEVQKKHEEFVSKLKTTLLEMIQNDVDAGQPRRAFGWAMRLYKFGRTYPPALFLDAALRYKNKDMTTANLRWESGKKLLKDANIDDWNDADKQLLMYGFYISAKFLKENLSPNDAKDIMNLGAPYFQGDKTWDAEYDEIVNKPLPPSSN